MGDQTNGNSQISDAESEHPAFLFDSQRFELSLPNPADVDGAESLSDSPQSNGIAGKFKAWSGAITRLAAVAKWRNRKRGAPVDRVGSFEERYALAHRFGSSGLSFFALYEGWEYFHPPMNPGFVAFERHGRAAVVCGDPVCAPEHEKETLASFLNFCAREKLTPAFANATERFTARYDFAGLARLKIGEEPFFDASEWAPRGDRTKKVRSAANQARKNGVTVEILAAGTTPPPSLEREIADVIAEWRSTRKVKALGFTLRLAPLVLSNDKIVLLALKGGRLEAFLTCVPYAGGTAFYFEDLIRRKSAPNGASEILVLEAIAECGRRGASVANFGLAPLRGCREQPGGRRAIGWMLDVAYHRLNLFYRFRPLDHFKSKFGPSRYEPAYLVYPPGKLPTAAIGVLRAFTPGRAGPLTTAFSRLRPVESGGGSILDLPIAAISAVASIALIGMLWFEPDLAVHAIVEVTEPVFMAEGMARAHLFVDVFLLAFGGGWLVRSKR